MKMVKRGNIDSSNTQIHDSHFPGLVDELQRKVAGLNPFYGPKPPLIIFRTQLSVCDT